VIVVRNRTRRGASEILASIIMIALTLSAFALIAPSLVSRTQVQASDIANQYQSGSLKLGELLSAVYHVGGSAPLKVGLYNYGTQTVTPVYVFVSTDSGPCVSACVCSWSLSPGSAITPNVPVQLDVNSCTTSTGGPVALATIGTYQLLVYSKDNLGYTFTL
jgi:flagellin-like protein